MSSWPLYQVKQVNNPGLHCPKKFKRSYPGERSTGCQRNYEWSRQNELHRCLCRCVSVMLLHSAPFLYTSLLILQLMMHSNFSEKLCSLTTKMNDINACFKGFLQVITGMKNEQRSFKLSPGRFQS